LLFECEVASASAPAVPVTEKKYGAKRATP